MPASSVTLRRDWLRVVVEVNITATSLSYRKAKNLTPQNQNPDLIEIKFGTVDYVGEMTPHAKFHVNLRKGGFSANR